MTKHKHKVSNEVKEQILNRIKNDGISVLQISEEHGISTKTIYGWLSRGTTGAPTITEFAKLKRQNKELLELVGKLTLEKTSEEKRGS